MQPARQDLPVVPGTTYRDTIRIMQPVFVYRDITGIAGAPVILQVPDHGLTSDWPVWVRGAVGMPDLNREPQRQRPHSAKRLDADRIEINALSAAELRPKGGQIIYRNPVDLSAALVVMTISRGDDVVLTLTVGSGLRISAPGTIDRVLTAGETSVLEGDDLTYTLDVSYPDGPTTTRYFTGVVGRSDACDPSDREILTAGEQGPPGRPGEPGAPGAPGAPGEPGLPGAAGALIDDTAGAGATDVTWSADQSVRFVGGAIEELRDELAAGTTTKGSASTNVLTKCLFGRLTADTVSAVTTYNIVMELETAFSGLQIAWPNIDSAAQPGFKCCVTVLKALDPQDWRVNINADGFYEGVQWNGVGTAPGSPRIAGERWDVEFSDIVPISSIPRTDTTVQRPLIRILLQVPAGSKISRPVNPAYSWANADSPRSLRMSSQQVAGVDNPYIYNNAVATPSGIPVPVVRYITYSGAKQVMIFGDSTSEGISSTPNSFGPIQKACYDLSTPEKPIEYFNAALHGQQPGLYSLRINDLMDKVKPQLITYAPYSINGVSAGGMTGYQSGEVYKNLTRVVDTLWKSESKPQLVILPGLPCNPNFRDTGAGDQQRRDLNEIQLTRYTAPISYVPEYATVITGERDADGQDLIKEGLTDDGVHLNIVGVRLQAEVISPFLAKLW